MNTKTLLQHILKILPIAALAVMLALGGLMPASAATTNTVIGWGTNYYGESNTPSGLTDVVAISAGVSHNLALNSDGTVIAWGDNEFGQATVPASLNDVVAIDAGGFYNLALKADGTVIAWGKNNNGQATVPPGLTGVIAISAGMDHSLALKADGTVIGWGLSNFGLLEIPTGLAGVVAIDAGLEHSLALKSDGTVVAWGVNEYGQLNIPSGLTGVVAIAAGGFHSLALKSDGTVVTWGHYPTGNRDTMPDGLTDVVAIAAGLYQSLVLKSDGTVVNWGYYLEDAGPYPSGLPAPVAIAAGGFHDLAIIPADAPANTPPTANPGGPYLGAINTSISFDGSQSADPDGDPLAYAWDFGDTSTASGVAPTHTYSSSGLYDVCLTVNDGTANSDPACTMAVVYDPSAGFVTGGGSISSPAGAYKADTSLAGKATFGFVAKYQKGANIPSGNTSFQFDMAGMAFASQSYEWLVVNQGGTNAQFKGAGSINGALDPNGNAYKFMLWASDGSPDTFRIRIWWEDVSGNLVDIYDNGASQPIGSGNIVVHTGK